MLIRSALGIIIKIINSKKPPDLYEYIRFPKRTCSKLSLHNPPKTAATFKLDIFPDLLALYNDLPRDIKLMITKRAVAAIKKLVAINPDKVWLGTRG